MTEPNDEDRERALPYTVADQERAIDWLGGYKHPGVPALAREFAAVRAAERERCAKAAVHAKNYHAVRGGYSNTFAGGLLAAAAAIREGK